ncbi:hypothetical protein NA57DRAFT_65198 [Rhizodiscina lignyota]|uniref:DUF676 domain-containing protein n=1 Tax=Rhizodiscina lignyota TaxID=1504668 RepID=A0A9P4M899_9PEZI|nr:hypothetical protein NA57DRAFT_65198 [Rhizodiscina lignyota]
MAPSDDSIFGIREVYRPADSNPDVDIVAVHGLTGEALKTWTSKKNDVCWLHHPDFLPRYITNARVLVWGYNASISSFKGRMPSSDRIHHHAQTLVAQLCADRRLERRQDKPIIFLCHSLGGIIVKRALAYSSSRQSARLENLHSIFTCTYGILFFGTPHRGTSKAQQLAMLQKIASAAVPKLVGQFDSNLVKALESESETLQNITDHFIPLMKHFSIFFFWEQRKTELGYKKDYVVEKESAAPDFDDTERSGLDADHAGMCQFEDHTSQNFRLVIAALDKYCEEAPEIIGKRWQNSTQALGEQRRREAMDKLRQIQDLQVYDEWRSD